MFLIYKHINNIINIISLTKIKKNILNLIKIRFNKRFNIKYISLIYHYKLFNSKILIKLILNNINKIFNINFIFYNKLSFKFDKYNNIFINRPINYYYKDLNDKFDWKLQFKARINKKNFFHLLHDIKKIFLYSKNLIHEKADNLINSCIKFDNQFDYYDLCKNINYNNLYDFNELSKLFWKRILLIGLTNDNILHKSITTMMNYVIKKIQFHYRIF